MPMTTATPRISYRVDGHRGSPVLLVMGMGMRGRLWEPQIKGLSQSHQVASFDNRGIGESESAGGVWTMKDFAEDALRVANELGFNRFHLVGVSLGGMVVQHMALMAQERLRSLSLIATQAGGPTGFIPTPTGLKSWVRTQMGEGDRVNAVSNLLYPEHFRNSVDPKEMEERMSLAMGDRAPRRSLFRQLFAVMRHDTRARLSEIKVPTLVVRPGMDILVRPSHSDFIRSQIPHAEMLRLEDAGHGCVFQSADILNARLLHHFSSADAKEHTR